MKPYIGCSVISIGNPDGPGLILRLLLLVKVLCQHLGWIDLNM